MPACHYFCPVFRCVEVGIVGKKLSAAKMSTRSKGNNIKKYLLFMTINADCERLECTTSGIRNDKQCLLHGDIIFSLDKSSCAEKLCSHPKATNWVSCYNCKQWYHCICYKIPYSIAKTQNFCFYL